MTLTVDQVLLIGLVASALGWLIRLVVVKLLKKKISRTWITVIVFVVSAVLGFLFLVPKIPATTDPMELATALVNMAAAVLGMATLIYNIILEKVLVYLGADIDTQLRKSIPIDPPV